MNPLNRRLFALETAPSARRLVLHVYATHAEADAANEPPAPGTAVLNIITGVPRWAGPTP